MRDPLGSERTPREEDDPTRHALRPLIEICTAVLVDRIDLCTKVTRQQSCSVNTQHALDTLV
jgi:hypothetical protein